MNRCAIYARYSSDNQSPASIDDQIRKCREHAEQRDWTVLQEHVYSDAEVSGAGADRPGLMQLEKAIARVPLPFEVLLVDDTSRLYRNLGDAMRLGERLKFAGVRVVYVSQAIDTDNEQSDVLMTVHGLVDSLYIKELAKKTHRGLEGRALKGLHTGGRCFGYKIEALPDDGGARLVVDETEAAIVRRIFEMYAAGTSLVKVAGALNTEKIPPPRLRAGKTLATWCPSAVRAMLRNEIYTGKLVWNRSTFVKRPGTNKRIRRARPAKDWRVIERPELRIVSEALWRSVVERRDIVAELFSKPGGGTKRTGGYLLSGFLKCGVCGANLIIVAGRGRRTRKSFYGCPQHYHRRACSNAVTIRQDLIEATFFSEIQKRVLSEKAINYTLAQMTKQVREAKRNVSGEVAALDKRRSEIERELARLTTAIAETGGSRAVMDAIVARERERDAVNQKLAAKGQDSFEERIEELRKFVTSRLTNIRDLLAIDPAQSRAELAKHAQAIRLLPGEDGSYVAEGEWNLFGRGSDFEVVAGVGFEPTTFGL